MPIHFLERKLCSSSHPINTANDHILKSQPVLSFKIILSQPAQRKYCYVFLTCIAHSKELFRNNFRKYSRFIQITCKVSMLHLSFQGAVSFLIFHVMPVTCRGPFGHPKTTRLWRLSTFCVLFFRRNLNSRTRTLPSKIVNVQARWCMTVKQNSTVLNQVWL